MPNKPLPQTSPPLTDAAKDMPPRTCSQGHVVKNIVVVKYKSENKKIVLVKYKSGDGTFKAWIQDLFVQVMSEEELQSSPNKTKKGPHNQPREA